MPPRGVYDAERLAKLAEARTKPRRITDTFREAARRAMVAKQPFLEAGKRRAREAKLAASKTAELHAASMTEDDAINLYRREKAGRVDRNAGLIAEAKAAFDRLLADLQAHQKGGRPRKPVAAVSEGRRRG